MRAEERSQQDLKTRPHVSTRSVEESDRGAIKSLSFQSDGNGLAIADTRRSISLGRARMFGKGLFAGLVVILLISTSAFAQHSMNFKSDGTFASYNFGGQFVYVTQTTANNGQACGSAPDPTAFAPFIAVAGGSVPPGPVAKGPKTTTTCLGFAINNGAVLVLGTAPIQDGDLTGDVDNGLKSTATLQVNVNTANEPGFQVSVFDLTTGFAGSATGTISFTFNSADLSTATTWSGHLQQLSGTTLIDMHGSGNSFLALLTGNVNITASNGQNYNLPVTGLPAYVGSNQNVDVNISQVKQH